MNLLQRRVKTSFDSTKNGGRRTETGADAGRGGKGLCDVWEEERGCDV